MAQGQANVHFVQIFISQVLKKQPQPAQKENRKNTHEY